MIVKVIYDTNYGNMAFVAIAVSRSLRCLYWANFALLLGVWLSWKL